MIPETKVNVRAKEEEDGPENQALNLSMAPQVTDVKDSSEFGHSQEQQKDERDPKSPVEDSSEKVTIREDAEDQEIKLRRARENDDDDNSLLSGPESDVTDIILSDDPDFYGSIIDENEDLYSELQENTGPDQDLSTGAGTSDTNKQTDNSDVPISENQGYDHWDSDEDGEDPLYGSRYTGVQAFKNEPAPESQAPTPPPVEPVSNQAPPAPQQPSLIPRRLAEPDPKSTTRPVEDSRARTGNNQRKKRSPSTQRYAPRSREFRSSEFK